MHRIIELTSIVLLATLLLQSCWAAPTPEQQANQGNPLSQEAHLQDSQSTINTAANTKRKYNEPNPSLLWASDQVKYWVYDGATIHPQAWDKEWVVKFNEIRAFTSFQEPFQLELFAYPSVETKAIRTHSMKEAHVETKAVHLVSNQYFNGEDWGQQYRPLIREALGESQNSALEVGLAMQWCEKIRGKSISHWVSLLAQADALPDLAVLYDKAAFEAASPIAAELAAASWVSYCIEKKGKDWFLDHYKKASPSISTLKTWHSEWSNWILNEASLSISKFVDLGDKPLYGFTFAHEGYRIYNGYGSNLAKKSLEYLVNLGTNAVAIVPYSFMRSPHKASHIPIVQHAGAENDQSVLFSHFSAQALGQFTLLKPQVWLNGSWPGDIDFKDNQSWDQFHAYYRTWIMHFALLAEMNGFDGFCIGTEFRYATLKHPEYWRQLIKDIRKIYHGPLTYAANWGEECEKITFWDELDFIGVNCYYPLLKKAEASKADLEQGAAKNLAKIRSIHDEFKRPVWLTEVGFRSAQSPWKSPHEEAGIRLIDNDAQALCYEVLLSELEKNDWVKGMFWWKWPSYLHHNEDHGRGYMPYQKETENVVKHFFKGNN